MFVPLIVLMLVLLTMVLGAMVVGMVVGQGASCYSWRLLNGGRPGRDVLGRRRAAARMTAAARAMAVAVSTTAMVVLPVDLWFILSY